MQAAQQLFWDSSWCTSLVGTSQQQSWEKQAGHPKGCTDGGSGLVFDSAEEGSCLEPPLLAPGSAKEGDCIELPHSVVPGGTEEQ